MPAPYPLLLEPILLSKVWGGDRLASMGKRVKPGDTIGESWELADLPQTSASGAGGGAFRSRIANGPLAGHTLHDALTQWGDALLGKTTHGASGDFPLLVKFLDARENLSVQVHPSERFARENPGAHLKTECWYIIDAAPGAMIYKGVRPGVTPEAFARHIAQGTCQDDLIAVPAIPGECHTLPSGTCHALGAGVLVAEVQTPSDTTFRVYDWGREGRELHVDQAVRCIDFGPAPEATRSTPGAARTRLVHTPFFSVDEITLTPGRVTRLGEGLAATAVIVIRGEARLSAGGVDLPLLLGSTSLVPASLAGSATIAAPTPLTALIATLA